MLPGETGNSTAAEGVMPNGSGMGSGGIRGEQLASLLSKAEQYSRFIRQSQVCLCWGTGDEGLNLPWLPVDLKRVCVEQGRRGEGAGKGRE